LGYGTQVTNEMPCIPGAPGAVSLSCVEILKTLCSGMIPGSTVD